MNERYSTIEDYIDAINLKIDEIIAGLPTILVVEVDDDIDEEDIDDEICDKISDMTGWLINSFEYEEIK